MEQKIKLFSDQLDVSEDYVLSKKAIVINILGENICRRNTYHSVAHMKFEDYPEKERINLCKWGLFCFA